MTPFGEFDFIARFLKPLASGQPGALGLADDAAVLRIDPGEELVIAKDGIVEGVHFLPDCSPEAVAWKLLGVNVSDLAAMGARPLGYLTFVARTSTTDMRWLKRFAAGLAEAQEAWGLGLLGGDTVATQGPLVLSCTALGALPAGTAVRRGGAAPGDVVFVSGTLGDAALGLRVLKGFAVAEDEAVWLVERYRRPQPRVALGQALRGVASAMIDVSDGLLADLGHILDQSRVGAVVRVADLPLSETARHIPGARECALVGGDDYELLFTLPPHRLEGGLAAADGAAIPVTPIGEITAEAGLHVLDANGEPVESEARGWRHF